MKIYTTVTTLPRKPRRITAQIRKSSRGKVSRKTLRQLARSVRKAAA